METEHVDPITVLSDVLASYDSTLPGSCCRHQFERAVVVVVKVGHMVHGIDYETPRVSHFD